MIIHLYKKRKYINEKTVKIEIQEIIKKIKLNCSVEECKDKVNWNCISGYQTLSEPFIREFKDKVNWFYIFKYQTLSQPFIKEFKNEVN